LLNRHLAASLLLASAALAAAALPTVPGALAQPAAVPDEAAVQAMVDEVLQQLVPLPQPGEVGLRPAAGERDLKRDFLSHLEALPGFAGEAIVVDSGVHALAAMASTLDRPELLSCGEAGCRLAAPLLVERGAGLVIDGIELRLVQEAGALLSVQGELFVTDARILGWSEASDGPARTDALGDAFRPWLAAVETGRLTIRRSHLAHLGYLSNSTQGLALTDANRDPPDGRPSGDIVQNRIENLYFGFFTYGAEGVRFLRNEVERSHVYGIDPHDFTRDLLIAENFVRGTRDSHGVVLSYQVYDSMVVRNRSIGNGGAGFFVDKGSWGVTFAHNEAIGNGTDGIVAYESRKIGIIGNYVADNRRAGIRVRASADIRVLDNIIHHNGGPGIFVYDWSHAAREPDEGDRRFMQPAAVLLLNNRMSDNASGDCSIQGEVTLIAPTVGTSDCQGAP